VLLRDEATAIASAAAEGIAALGPQAVSRAGVDLEHAALREDAAALSAALALLDAQVGDRDVCKSASSWRNADAARVLAALGSCPAQPLVEALNAARDDGRRARAALAALLTLPTGAAPQAAAALSRLIEKGPPDVAAEAARAAQQVGAKGAGPALVTVVRRERRALQAQRSAVRTPDVEDDAHAAAELVQQAARVPAADRARYDALMKKLAARAQAADARTSARARLSELLSGAPARRRKLLVSALQSGLALGVPGMAAEAAALKDDPEIEVARAARGEREPARTEPPADACLPSTGLPPPGCLAAIAAETLAPAAAERARGAARLALLSDDGAERSSACELLRKLDGDAARQLVAPFARDPERRVRVACSSTAPVPETRAPNSR
jgi:hypothetical protein